MPISIPSTRTIGFYEALLQTGGVVGKRSFGEAFCDVSQIPQLWFKLELRAANGGKWPSFHDRLLLCDPVKAMRRMRAI
ncbi:hypothetical protein [Pseudovibrio sp. Tun.PSC04-5.I4]|uniref:hypothetical protein n=1 Tax=Pseudovibrio sp. Tun.PSC04-5.I4 TaxID=1798213 RepID=UPI000B88B3CD|nr:hypothetical protein [Pseudovibrio sp. Tun.PSC04-5.I4]